MRLARRDLGKGHGPAAADLSRRPDYVAPDEFANASSEVEDAIHDEWKTHIASSEAVLGVEGSSFASMPRTMTASTMFRPFRRCWLVGSVVLLRNVRPDLASAVHCQALPCRSRPNLDAADAAALAGTAG